MNKYYQLSIVVILSISSYFTVAEIILYPFSDPVREERFNSLIKELRCPKCQNNNLADSNAPLSTDLKAIIYEKINAGESDNEIIYFLKERYGDFISYRPPVKPSTWLIWYGPFVILIIGGFMVFRYVSTRQNKNGHIPHTASTESGDDLLTKWQDEMKEEDDSK